MSVYVSRVGAVVRVVYLLLARRHAWRTCWIGHDKRLLTLLTRTIFHVVLLHAVLFHIGFEYLVLIDACVGAAKFRCILQYVYIDFKTLSLLVLLAVVRYDALQYLVAHLYCSPHIMREFTDVSEYIGGRGQQVVDSAESILA